MKTPQEKYLHDPQYRMLVKQLEDIIHHAQFTPSEIREAAMLACINYEMHHMRPQMIIDPEVSNALDVLRHFQEHEQDPNKLRKVY